MLRPDSGLEFLVASAQDAGSRKGVFRSKQHAQIPTHLVRRGIYKNSCGARRTHLRRLCARSICVRVQRPALVLAQQAGLHEIADSVCVRY